MFLPIWVNSFRRTIERMNASYCLCFLSSLPVQMYLTSLNQGYFLTVSQPPLPWVMVCRDSLSDSDEVMSEPRTKLSLPFPTETPSLLAVYGIGLFFPDLILRSTTLCCHFIHCTHCLAESTILQWDREKCKEEKSIISLLGVAEPLWCNSSWSLFNLKWPYLQSSITTMRKEGEKVG